MCLSLLYRLVGRLLEVARVHRMDPVAKDAEILVLRHQLAVLRRQAGRPRFTWSDRAVVALLAPVIPGQRWAGFLVTPKTILSSTPKGPSIRALVLAIGSDRLTG